MSVDQNVYGLLGFLAFGYKARITRPAIKLLRFSCQTFCLCLFLFLSFSLYGT